MLRCFICLVLVTMATESHGPIASRDLDPPYCAVRYRRLCQGKGRHVACQFPIPGPGESCFNYTVINFTKELQHFVIHYINRRRQRVAMGIERVRGGAHLPRPEVMMQVEWDRELAVLAQRLADQCSFVHDGCRATVRYPYAGQTVGEVKWRRTSQSHLQSLARAIRRVLDAWWGERRRATVKQITQPFRLTNRGNVWGHFSQLAVWTLRAVGCGAVRHGSTHPKILLVCDFSHTNMLGQPTIVPGPMGRCPIHTTRKQRTFYPALCSPVRHQQIEGPYSKTNINPEDAHDYSASYHENDLENDIIGNTTTFEANKYTLPTEIPTIPNLPRMRVVKPINSEDVDNEIYIDNYVYKKDFMETTGQKKMDYKLKEKASQIKIKSNQTRPVYRINDEDYEYDDDIDGINEEIGEYQMKRIKSKCHEKGNARKPENCVGNDAIDEIVKKEYDKDDKYEELTTKYSDFERTTEMEMLSRKTLKPQTIKRIRERVQESEKSIEKAGYPERERPIENSRLPERERNPMETPKRHSYHTVRREGPSRTRDYEHQDTHIPEEEPHPERQRIPLRVPERERERERESERFPERKRTTEISVVERITHGVNTEKQPRYKIGDIQKQQKDLLALQHNNARIGGKNRQKEFRKLFLKMDKQSMEESDEIYKEPIDFSQAQPVHTQKNYRIKDLYDEDTTPRSLLQALKEAGTTNELLRPSQFYEPVGMRHRWRPTKDRPERPGAKALLMTIAYVHATTRPTVPKKLPVTFVSLMMDKEDVEQLFKDTGFNPDWKKAKTTQ